MFLYLAFFVAFLSPCIKQEKKVEVNSRDFKKQVNRKKN